MGCKLGYFLASWVTFWVTVDVNIVLISSIGGKWRKVKSRKFDNWIFSFNLQRTFLQAHLIDWLVESFSESSNDGSKWIPATFLLVQLVRRIGRSQEVAQRRRGLWGNLYWSLVLERAHAQAFAIKLYQSSPTSCLLYKAIFLIN